MGLTSRRGRAGESLAIAYLELAGYTVTARNLRLGGVEVDVLAREGPAEVVVEVKCRGRPDFGGAAGAVDRGKRARLLRAARALLQEGAWQVRIDVVAVDLSPEGVVVRHYRGAVTE